MPRLPRHFGDDLAAPPCQPSRFPFPQLLVAPTALLRGARQYAARPLDKTPKQSMGIGERSDTLLNRLAELEKLAQAQRKEIRGSTLERGLFATRHGAMKMGGCRSTSVMAEENAP